MLLIPIQEFKLELEGVDRLGIKLLDNPYLNEEGQLVRKIYQTLVRKVDTGEVDENEEIIYRDEVVEEKNREVPAELANIIDKFIMGTVTTEEKAAVTQFAQTFNNNIVIV